LSEIHTPIGTNPSGATTGVRKTIAAQKLDAKKCEIAIHIGVFFDGTGNARDGNGNTHAKWKHESLRKHSNVARLFAAYPDDPAEGYFRMYVPGLGTPFPQIGEAEPAAAGNLGGQGGDGRVNFGLLHVFNAVHQAISHGRKPMFNAGTVQALCRNGPRVRYRDMHGFQHDNIEEPEDSAALRRVDMEETGGVLMTPAGDRSVARAFYAAQSAKLANLIANVAQKPVLKEVFIDVFGFSRGAAQARTFCNWTDEIFSGSRLFGVTAHLRFLGIFDSVASVGINTSAGIGGEGHMSWGDAPYLRIPSRVAHCEHYAAMHENRPSFPLEFVERNGNKPINCRQFAYPGVHCDVGGGYGPDEQGRWIGPEDFEDFGAKAPYRSAQGNRKPWELTPSLDDHRRGDILDRGAANQLRFAETQVRFVRPEINDLDSRKLSQVPLNHMYAAARAANVPLSSRLAVQQSGYDVLAIHPSTQRAFNEFMAVAGSSKPLRDWLTPYLAWRYQVRDHYRNFATTLRANAKDRDDLQGANLTLLADIDAVENDGAWQFIKDQLKGPLGTIFGTRTQRASKLAHEAPKLLTRMKTHAPTDAACERIFKYLCHDSYAGFRPFDALQVLGYDVLNVGSWEAQGYLRYRRRYEGDDSKLTQLNTPQAESQALTA
jgi:Uncharacterized alpha/beta hydrolase domain (DUF2235)